MHGDSLRRTRYGCNIGFRRWIDSRIDVEETTKKVDTNAAERFEPLIGEIEVSGAHAR